MIIIKQNTFYFDEEKKYIKVLKTYLYSSSCLKIEPGKDFLSCKLYFLSSKNIDVPNLFMPTVHIFKILIF